MRISYYLIIFFTLSITSQIYSFDNLDDTDDPTAEESSTRDFDLDEFDEVPDTTITRQAANPCEILNTLYDFKAYKVLENDLYAYTRPLVSRNILKNPVLQNFVPKTSQFNFSIFYEQATNLFSCCNGIEGYINLLDPTFLREIDLEIAEDNGLDIPKLLGLFKNAWAEQRRVGFYFGFWKYIKSFCFGLEIPLYLVERNFNLPPEDQQAIKENIAEATANLGFGCNANADQDQEEAYRKYALETRFGIGDTRLTIGWNAVDTDRFRLVLGPKIIFPTAATLTSGFIGADFKKALCRCYTDVESFVQRLDDGDESAAQEGTAIGLQSINQLGALVLTTDLGEDKRFQTAFCIQPEVRIDKQVSLLASLNINWQIPKQVTRYILEQQNSDDFIDSNFNPDDFPEEGKEEHCRQTLSFLSRRWQNWLFPCDYRVKMKGQLESQFTAGALFQFTDNWSSLLGYDYWRKEKECVSSVYHKCNPVNLSCIKLSRALAPTVSQHKLFLKLHYIKLKESHSFTFSFGADFPLISNGTSDTYTGFVNFEWDF